MDARTGRQPLAWAIPEAWSTVRRIASAVLITALALGSLSGCFLLPQAPRDEPRDRETAEAEEAHADGFALIGDCWEGSSEDMGEWSAWEGDGPVDCDENHQAYTFFSGELTVDIDEAWEDGSVTSELGLAVSELCTPKFAELGVPDAAARVIWFFFVAPEGDWEDGDHRVRCDVALTALDSDWYDPALEDLPADIDDLMDDIDDNPAVYEVCVIGDGFGPYESTEAYYSDCDSDEYYWRYAGDAEYDQPPGAPFPDSEHLYGFADDVCADFGARGSEVVLPYVPNGESWKLGDRSVYCWFSTIQEPSTPV